MTVLSDRALRERPPVFPFREKGVFGGVSRGLSSAGYDIRIAQNVILWPGRFVLVSSMEYFNMPDDLLGIVHDKSTWARRGLAVQNTVIEPGWCGYLTLEITMHAMRFCVLREGMGIAQVVFHSLDRPTSQPYCGKYQDQQAGPQPAITG